MAPNVEEDLLLMTTSLPRTTTMAVPKERLRPPTYNTEDYAIALRRWGRRPPGLSSPNAHEQTRTSLVPNSTSSNSPGYVVSTINYEHGNCGICDDISDDAEMRLRQFNSVGDLLNKLRADLRLAFPSFVQEFACGPTDGISLLLECLRGVQLSQNQPAGTSQGPKRPRARRAALDELGCVDCLAACAERCPEAARALARATPGLLALAVCLTSGLNRSRVLALQLFAKVAGTHSGHAAVSEALSTLRLRYGEGGRFRFLAGALLAAKAALPLRLAGLAFLNAFLASAPTTQSKLYIQAEACEAGLEPRALHEWVQGAEEHGPLTELLREEVQAWSRHCVDVEALQSRARRAEDTCRALSKQVATLQQQLRELQLERLGEYNGREQWKPDDRASRKKVSSGAEDEGISFSERSSSPEAELPSISSSADNERETTIDEVIEELRTIVKDAEEELHDCKNARHSSRSDESAIVPAIIHPQPPRRLPPCLLADPLGPQPLDEQLLLLLHEQQPGSESDAAEVMIEEVARSSERRRYLRRCQSQDHIEQQQQQRRQRAKLRASGGAVVEHIRKFESLSSLEREQVVGRSLDRAREQQRDHSTLFAGGRARDVLGIGKGRFNAGKYSGYAPHSMESPAEQQPCILSSSTVHLRGRVTDMLSGLY